jgi:hypothetical protein
MRKKIFFGVVGISIVGIAWWLISPLWRTMELNEPLPQAPIINDRLGTMDSATKEQFTQEVEAMRDQAMVVEEAMPSSRSIVLAEAPLVAHAHGAEGKALLIEVGGQKIVRFEDLKTINGPDLRIYLSADLGADDFVDLGPIRATEGSVNYSVPAGTDTEKYRNVLIWCRAFSVLFSYAELKG